jgi:hypothetical protein
MRQKAGGDAGAKITIASVFHASRAPASAITMGRPTRQARSAVVASRAGAALGPAARSASQAPRSSEKSGSFAGTLGSAGPSSSSASAGARSLPPWSIQAAAPSESIDGKRGAR